MSFWRLVTVEIRNDRAREEMKERRREKVKKVMERMKEQQEIEEEEEKQHQQQEQEQEQELCSLESKGRVTALELHAVIDGFTDAEHMFNCSASVATRSAHVDFVRTSLQLACASDKRGWHIRLGALTGALGLTNRHYHRLHPKVSRYFFRMRIDLFFN